MLYRLEYKFGGRAYVIEDDVRGIAEPSQYEAVADGLALTASDIYHHASSGESLLSRLEIVGSEKARI